MSLLKKRGEPCGSPRYSSTQLPAHAGLVIAVSRGGRVVFIRVGRRSIVPAGEGISRVIRLDLFPPHVAADVLGVGRNRLIQTHLLGGSRLGTDDRFLACHRHIDFLFLEGVAAVDVAARRHALDLHLFASQLHGHFLVLGMDDFAQADLAGFNLSRTNLELFFVQGQALIRVRATGAEVAAGSIRGSIVLRCAVGCIRVESGSFRCRQTRRALRGRATLAVIAVDLVLLLGRQLRRRH